MGRGPGYLPLRGGWRLEARREGGTLLTGASGHPPPYTTSAPARTHCSREQGGEANVKPLEPVAAFVACVVASLPQLRLGSGRSGLCRSARYRHVAQRAGPRRPAAASLATPEGRWRLPATAGMSIRVSSRCCSPTRISASEPSASIPGDGARGGQLFTTARSSPAARPDNAGRAPARAARAQRSLTAKLRQMVRAVEIERS